MKFAIPRTVLVLFLVCGMAPLPMAAAQALPVSLDTNDEILTQYDNTSQASLVKDIAPGTASANPTALTAARDRLLFLVDNRLWVSDGTEAGTFDLQAAFNFLNPHELTKVGDKVIFVARDGEQIWETAGTMASTKIIFSPPNPSLLDQLTDVNGTLYKVVDDCGPGSGRCIFIDPEPPPQTGHPRRSYYLYSFEHLTNVNGSLFYVVRERVPRPVVRQELWKDNNIVGEIPGGATFDPSEFTAVGSTLYFTANDGVNGWKIWKSDGVVIEMVPGCPGGPPGYDTPSDLTNVDGTLYFAAHNARGRGLFVLEDTCAREIPYDGGTVNHRPPAQLTNVNGTLFFVVSWEQGHELWKHDSMGVWFVKTITPQRFLSAAAPSNLAAIGGLLFFAGNDGVYGVEPWVSDGSANGTVMVADIAPGGESSNPSQFTEVQGKPFFTANNGANGIELWTLLPTDNDPADDTCAQADTFPLTPGADLWGGLEFPGDQDWHSVVAPATGRKMLLALHVVGRAENQQNDELTQNYDLEVYNNGCSTKLGGSYNAGNVDWVNGALPRKGDERILLNVTANAKYRTRVFGVTPADYIPGYPPATYHEFVTFGSKINSGVALTSMSTSYNPTPQPGAPAGVYTIVALFTNNSTLEFRDLTFDVTTLSGGNVLLNADQTGVSGVTSLSVPNHALCEPGFPSYVCRLDADIAKGLTSFTVPFRIGLQQRKPFTFLVDLYGNYVAPSGAASTGTVTGAELATDMAAQGFQFEVTEEQLQGEPPLAQGNTVYLPVIGK